MKEMPEIPTMQQHSQQTALSERQSNPQTTSAFSAKSLEVSPSTVLQDSTTLVTSDPPLSEEYDNDLLPKKCCDIDNDATKVTNTPPSPMMKELPAIPTMQQHSQQMARSERPSHPQTPSAFSPMPLQVMNSVSPSTLSPSLAQTPFVICLSIDRFTTFNTIGDV